MRRAALLGAAASSASLALGACTTAHGASPAQEPVDAQANQPALKAESAAPDSKVDTNTLDCTDIAHLSHAEIQVRETLKYVEKTPKPAQDCANCHLWKEPASNGACGGCTVVPGPIHPKGWCVAWVATRS